MSNSFRQSSTIDGDNKNLTILNELKIKEVSQESTPAVTTKPIKTSLNKLFAGLKM